MGRLDKCIPLLLAFLSGPIGWGDEPVMQRIHVENGTLYFEDRSEVALWGVNFQTAMSWEWGRFNKAGLVDRFDLNEWKQITDHSLDEIQLMGCDLIRIHLSPGDFADRHGNLVETPWLEMLDYTLAECRRRGIYVNLALMNHLGHFLDESFIGKDHAKENKWEWITVPGKIRASETYIRQLVNRRNPHDGDCRYKDNPAWVVAEFINEPMFPRERPSRATSPEGVRIYESWLNNKDLPDTPDSFSEYKYQSIKSFINRITDLLQAESVEAVPCWNLFWVQGPRHQGWESYNAAADSEIRLVSFSTYPGQGEIQAANRRPMDLSGKNFLPYLQQAYDREDWQGWLRQDRFKDRFARIVYEYEGWANQSAYLYPAMARYFRAQGAQMATMWTYSLNGLAENMGRLRTHNLNVRTTPRKAAAFMVAGEIFRNTPRYERYLTADTMSDSGENHSFSFEKDFAAYFDGNQFVSSGSVPDAAGELPSHPTKIAGYGSSRFIDYQGRGLYFLEKVTTAGEEVWKLTLLPHARFVDTVNDWHVRAVELDDMSPADIKMNLPGSGQQMRIYAVSQDIPVLLRSFAEDIAVSLKLSPGHYVIKRIPDSMADPN